MNPCVSSLFSSVSSSPADTFSFERELYRQGLGLVAGVDEAGRGPLAGPVVAACVILPQDCVYQIFQDSKKLTSRQRDQLFEVLQHNGALIGVGQASSREIEGLNILQASLLAMKRALTECTAANNGCPPNYLLVDGTFTIPAAINQLPLVKGESKSASIAAASIIAKVTRDRLMAEAHRHYPHYGFNRHQGYPTKEHRQAIRCHGPCPLHRRTFRGVAEYFTAEMSIPAPPSLDCGK
jgi:ribonuclease HII